MRKVRDHAGGVVRRADDVDVADGDLAAPQAAGQIEPFDRRPEPNVSDRLLRDLQRLRKRRAPQPPLIRENAAPPVFDRLASQPRNAVEPARADSRFEIGQRRDAVIAEEHRGGLGADAANPENFQERRRKALVQLGQLLGAAGADELLDDRADRLPDPRELEMLARRDQIGQRRRVLDRGGSLLVGRVLIEGLARHLHERADFEQLLRDFGIG